jgi:hypothetical protein
MDEQSNGADGDAGGMGMDVEEWLKNSVEEVSRTEGSTGNSANFAPPVEGGRSSTALITRSSLGDETVSRGYYRQVPDKATGAKDFLGALAAWSKENNLQHTLLQLGTWEESHQSGDAHLHALVHYPPKTTTWHNLSTHLKKARLACDIRIPRVSAGSDPLLAGLRYLCVPSPTKLTDISPILLNLQIPQSVCEDQNKAMRRMERPADSNELCDYLRLHPGLGDFREFDSEIDKKLKGSGDRISKLQFVRFRGWIAKHGQKAAAEFDFELGRARDLDAKRCPKRKMSQSECLQHCLAQPCTCDARDKKVRFHCY